MNRFLLFLLSIFLLSGTDIHADILYVGPNETYKYIGASMYDVKDGDTIMVRDGVYDKTVTVRSPLTLMAENKHKAVIGDGNGIEGIIKIASGSVVIDGFKFNGIEDKPGIFVGGVDETKTIANCVIKNNEINNRLWGIRIMPNASNCIIEGNTITGSLDYGIVDLGKGVHTFSNNHIEGSNWYGILIHEVFSGSVTVRDNTLISNKNHGIEIRKSNVTLEGNTIMDNAEFGIHIENNVNHIAIRDSNRIENNGIHGIMVGRFSSALIKDNIIQENADRGIEIGDSSSVEISGNTIKNNGYYGIMNYGSAIISGNTISENKLNGIENRTGAIETLIKDNQITGNVENGVFLMEQAVLHGNTISGNGLMGVFIEGPREIVYITNMNQILSNREHGILILGDGTAEILNNTIAYNGTAVTGMEDFSGILNYGTARIEGNIIKNNYGGGITVGDSSVNTIIKNNLGINGNREGIMIRGPATVENNAIDSNQFQGIYVGPIKDISLNRNTISQNRTGVYIHADASNISIQNCDFIGNERGIATRGEVKVRRSTIENSTDFGIRIIASGIDLGQKSEKDGGYNTIRNNVPYNIKNRTPDTTMACHNYWYLEDTLSIDSTLLDDEEDSSFGPVIFTPYISKDITGVEDLLPFPLKEPEIQGLQKIYPNPSAEIININYAVTDPGKVTLKVLDLGGKNLTLLIPDQFHEPGPYSFQWDGRSSNGRLVNNGIYLIMMITNSGCSTKKVQIFR